MRIACIADTQGYAPTIKPELMPMADMLLIGGDLAGGGSIAELGALDNWLGELPYRYKVIVGGNHDQGLRYIDGHTFFKNAIYLQDEIAEVAGLKIYGSPINEMNELRLYYDWAFCDPQYIRRAADAIPEGLDILLTHGCAYGVLDQLHPDHRGYRKSVGSRDILRAVERAKPRFHVFGHIHEAYGTVQIGETVFVNGAICDAHNKLFVTDEDGLVDHNRLLQPPQIIEVNISEEV